MTLLSSLGLSFHCYADDTQLYIPCTSTTYLQNIEFLQNSYKFISNWLADNFLKLNHDKTEVILIGTPHSVSKCKLSADSLILENSKISFSTTVKNLGVIFDESLSFLPHIKKCRKNCFILLRNLSILRPYFSRSSLESIINTLITSKIDYCNSLFSSLPTSTIGLLQSIQNYAARLLFRSHVHSHVTPLLFELHWLPVAHRISFKILIITFKVVHYSIPLYLVSHITLKTNPRNLRNHDALLLEIPRSRSSRMGDRSFSFIAPKLWNPLPFNIRNSSSVKSFKKSLKTYFFTTHYHSFL